MHKWGVVRAGALAWGLLGAWSGPVPAQTAPLRKTDLVRLLTNPSLSKAQVVERIQGPCLAFNPTGRDRADLQALGADATVMAAIDNCLRRRAAPTAAQRPAARPPATAPARPAPTRAAAPAAGLLILAVQPRVFAPAGTETAFQVRVTRAGLPVPNLPLTVRGEDLRAVTNTAGVATFRLAAGTAAGVRILSVVPAGGDATARPAEVRLGVVAGPPSRVEVDPRRLEARTGEPVARRPVTVSLEDEHGNPLGGERVEFRPLTAALGVAPVSGRTDSLGRVSVSFVNAAFKANGDLGVFVRGAQVAALPVEVEPLVLSQSRTGFVTGQGQSGVAGRPLGQPVVLEVRDTAGAPVAGKTVTFETVNGEATPSVATTNDAGQVSVSVTAGRQAGTTVVRATAGDVRKEMALPVSPGPAAALAIMRDSAPVERALELSSTRPVLLRVGVRDSFGNEAPVASLRASVSEPGVLRVARAEVRGGAGLVELRARSSGSADVLIEASGVRATVPAQVLLPLTAAGGGMIAVRVGYTGFNYGFHDIALRGRPGPMGEVAFGWSVRGLRVALGVTFAKLRLDTGAVRAGTGLSHASLRLEYTFLSTGSVRPVMTLGGGRYQTRVAALNGLGRHTNQFWLAGAGLDFPMRPGMTVELRAASHQLLQTKTQYAEAGHVGSLTAVTVGFRFGS